MEKMLAYYESHSQPDPVGVSNLSGRQIFRFIFKPCFCAVKEGVHIVIFLFYFLFFIIAASDFFRHRIPNRVLFLMLLPGIVNRGWSCLLLLMVILILQFPLFLFRMTGAGDLKLVAVIFGCFGLIEGSKMIFCGLALGAVWSAYLLGRHHCLISRLLYLVGWFRRMIQSKKITAYADPKRDGYRNTIPMGTCLFAGSLLYQLFLTVF